MHVTRCGSTTHLKVTHRDCPLNRKRAAPAPANPSAVDSDAEEDSDDSDDSDDVVLSKRFPGATKTFPYPVGTWVAVEFGDDIFPGKITKLYPKDDLCEVVFTDGDRADYEADQITYAKQLYESAFLPARGGVPQKR